MTQNETKRHFQLRNLDADMRDAQTTSMRAVSKDEIKRRSRETYRGIAVCVVFVVIVIAVLLFR